mmetsp:Transcript_12968/g.24030  ORF Transcript_12968/g.24030 Transcript_12968/m.24030 type:complete len:252 (-) Transcript_12968:332-1087(-)
MELERTYSRHDHGAARLESSFTAFDVAELFKSKVCTKATLSNNKICHLEGCSSTYQRAAPVCNVCEGSTVNNSRIVLQGLNDVRLKCVTEKGCHCTCGTNLVRGNCFLSAAGVAHNDFSKSVPQVVKVGSQAENSHNFACHADVKAILTRDSICSTSEADCNVAECSVVHVHYALELYPAHVQNRLEIPVNVIICHRSEKVVRCRNGVHVACEVQVDVGHRVELSIPSPCGTTFDPKYRAQARLPKRNHCA